jgi:hypothetical protein
LGLAAAEVAVAGAASKARAIAVLAATALRRWRRIADLNKRCSYGVGGSRALARDEPLVSLVGHHLSF